MQKTMLARIGPLPLSFSQLFTNRHPQPMILIMSNLCKPIRAGRGSGVNGFCLSMGASTRALRGGVRVTAILAIMAMLAMKEAPTPHHATGTFEIKRTSLPLADPSTDKALGRMSFDKQFHGDLEGTSKGEGLTAGNPQTGSAGYVAMEYVTGTLAGRSGTFVFQHSATMNHGAQQLSVIIVPESGAGQLAGITGKMTINVVDGKHLYDFEYTLPETEKPK
jgi:hypothetical protein